MSGAQAPIYLLEKAAGTPAAGATRQPRDYARHWTPVHLDVVVDDGRGRDAGRQRPAPGSKTRPPRMPGAASPT